jgi:phosphoribosyl-AMP cyclohydrolase
MRLPDPDTLTGLLDFEKMGGLVPIVAQDSRSGEVLMVAFADREAVRLTAETGYAHYYSRSRDEIWKKGATSGHVQKIVELRIDCDNDTLLYVVEQEGAACHTGYFSCFYRRAEGTELRVVGEKPAGGRGY